MVSHIPAGGIFSPYPDYDHIACGVFSGGNVYWCDNVTFNSYGQTSPVIAMYGMYEGNNAFYVELDGSTYGDHINDIIAITYSCGISINSIYTKSFIIIHKIHYMQ